MKTEKRLFSLIPLGEFKSVLCIDDRDDALGKFCLVTATYTIEQYCMRRLLKKRHFEQIEFNGDLLLTLKEYPVYEILAAYAISKEQRAQNREQRKKGVGELIEPELYQVKPECGCEEDWPFTLALSPVMKRVRGLEAIKVVYTAGYSSGKAPPDLASACLELAAWNMGRYKGRRIGMTGNIRGNSKDGEHFEMSMPEQVRKLLEPYKRKVI